MCKVQEVIEPITTGEECIQFLKEALPSHICHAFWEELQICIDREMGKSSLLETIPMSDKQRKSFLNEKLPVGKYMGQKVKTVLKKDKDHLLKMCYRPSNFQLSLRRFLAGQKRKSKRSK